LLRKMHTVNQDDRSVERLLADFEIAPSDALRSVEPHNLPLSVSGCRKRYPGDFGHFCGRPGGSQGE
ncbi:MAG: hypothetical protein WBW88_01545, partial [Rhodothermales bacterium]